MLKISNKLGIYLLNALEAAFPEAAAKAREQGNTLDPQLVIASKPEFGDFQVNGALKLSKTLKQSPRNIAFEVVKQLEQNQNFKMNEAS